MNIILFSLWFLIIKFHLLERSKKYDKWTGKHKGTDKVNENGKADWTKKLDEIPLKDREKELKQRLLVRDIEKKVRELEEKEFKCLHGWWGEN